MQQEIILIEGPLAQKVKQEAQRYLVQIAKRNIDQGKYPHNLSYMQMAHNETSLSMQRGMVD